MYSFTNLEPGNYTVTEDQQAGWEQSVPGSGYYTINLSDKSAYRVDFGNFRISKASSGLSRASSRVSYENVVDATGVPLHPDMPVTPEMLGHNRKMQGGST